jgi:predicted ribosomally synthesized peptide with SipW-like signal peptide
MKTIILSVVVIGALIAAGIGGTLADFSDIEVSSGNYFQTGGMDLVVSDEDGNEYNGTSVPAIYTVTTGWPDCSKDRSFDLHNAGSNEQGPSSLYMHVKGLSCNWIMPKIPYAYIVCEDDECVVSDNTDVYARPVTEPTLVAICGGLAGERNDGTLVNVPGVQCFGLQDCLLSKFISVTMEVAGPYNSDNMPPKSVNVPPGDWQSLDLSGYDNCPADNVVSLYELACNRIHLADLPGCWSIWVKTHLLIFDIPEEMLIDPPYSLDSLDSPPYVDGWFEDTNNPFNDWPTNMLMYMKAVWKFAFELHS